MTAQFIVTNSYPKVESDQVAQSALAAVGAILGETTGVARWDNIVLRASARSGIPAAQIVEIVEPSIRHTNKGKPELVALLRNGGRR